MKIVNEKPPIYDELIKAGMHFNPATTIFTFAENVYNPAGLDLSDDILIHEDVHGEQQGYSEDGARAWWGRYLTDNWFRIDQEAEAYAWQYHYLCHRVTDRNIQARILSDLARILSSPTYGSVITQVGATKLIKEKAHKI